MILSIAGRIGRSAAWGGGCLSPGEPTHGKTVVDDTADTPKKARNWQRDARHSTQPSGQR